MIHPVIRALGTALLTTGLLSACATREGFDARQAAFVGRSEAELVAALGVPARIHEAEGRRFLQYEDRRLVSYGDGFGYGYGFGRRFAYAGTGFGPVVETRACDLTFELRGGRVVSFNARGNDCLAPEPRQHAAAS